MKLFCAASVGLVPGSEARSQDGIRFQLAESYGPHAQSRKIKCCEFFRLRRNFSAQSVEVKVRGYDGRVGRPS
jgi:hypothetical protein